jgi:hypothetical protein
VEPKARWHSSVVVSGSDSASTEGFFSPIASGIAEQTFQTVLEQQALPQPALWSSLWIL